MQTVTLAVGFGFDEDEVVGPKVTLSEGDWTLRLGSIPSDRVVFHLDGGTARYVRFNSGERTGGSFRAWTPSSVWVTVRPIAGEAYNIAMEKIDGDAES